ncbi:MAG TPA: hypothetical protein ENL10_05350, partial [Candidatus Cloacimonetes bacterium]|nr:hypothetical protein [Candidatus Cloacimonadota bacterium]
MGAPNADRVEFNNSSNGFTSTRVQPAIEEARDTALGKARFSITLISNGALGNNEWVTYSELTPKRKIWIPIDSVINELTY